MSKHKHKKKKKVYVAGPPGPVGAQGIGGASALEDPRVDDLKIWVEYLVRREVGREAKNPPIAINAGYYGTLTGRQNETLKRLGLGD